MQASLILLKAGALATVLLASACAKQPAPPPQPPTVEVMIARPGRLPIVHEFVGRISAIRSAEVRARVAGIVQKRAYQEGTDVREGDLLFVIDPAPARAALRERQAALSQARATAANAKMRAQRLRDLAESGVVARQDLEDATAQATSSAAAVEQAAASVEQARLDLQYTKVRAPISGRAGKALVTEGALVGEDEATPLTTVEQIDEVYVDFSQSVAQLEALRSEQASGAVDLAAPPSQQVRVLFENGAPYPHEATLGFSALAVNPATGAVSMRAVLPNPEHRLLPGMFVRVAVAQGARRNAYVIPQSAVQRDAKGLYAFLVSQDGKVAQRSVQAQGMEGSSWVVTGGLKPGDRIIVSGIQQVRPGAAVKAVIAAQGGADRAASP